MLDLSIESHHYTDRVLWSALIRGVWGHMAYTDPSNVINSGLCSVYVLVQYRSDARHR